MMSSLLFLKTLVVILILVVLGIIVYARIKATKSDNRLNQAAIESSLDQNVNKLVKYVKEYQESVINKDEGEDK